jgi:ribosomal protein S18 acetylase RimI-like enzyme
VEIRHGVLADLPYLYEICHLTGDAGKDATGVVSDRFLLGQIFAAPYLVRDPQWCWVACDSGTPVGYLLTTPDTRSFYAWEASSWSPSLRGLYPLPVPGGLSGFESRMRERVHAPPTVPAFVQAYPAHLHIDLLPRAQGHRLGSWLMEQFLDQCRAEGIPGIHLGVSATNTGAIGFYRKLGFETLTEEPWGFFLGLKP